MNNVKLIIGLGNPGKKYEKTRHNIGSKAIDELRFLNLKNVVLTKPQTFMNESGKTVKNLLKNYKTKPDNLIVMHDDIDLPIGKIRIVKNRGAAGHKGVESIIKALGTKNFIRFRIGIQPKRKPTNSSAVRRARQNKKFLAGFVLQKFNKDEEMIVKGVIEKTIEATNTVIKEGLEKAMSKFNK